MTPPPTALDLAALRAGARRVLDMEAAGLRLLADSLDDSFDRAVSLLHAVSGRIIVTGMGKSGHVGRKIAATLASTGAPSFFVHPAEASHGDLGMVTKADAVLALSNSGDTAELSDIIAYTRRFEIPLIGVTRRAPSTLADQADVLLLLPPAPEACPLGLAPTTSTTMTLALGDALAVALLEARGFTAADFRQFHPGGKLGQSLLLVTDVMHAGGDMPLCRLDAPLQEVILEMTGKRLGCVGVVDSDGRLAGVVTDGDLRRHLSHEMMSASAESLMSRQPKTIRPKALAAEALGEMNKRQITSLFVVDQGRPLGVVHIHDCLRAGVA
ncbi:MAG TPA: KpsF/GutQ family sugar-phosphate isomerase [Azospirillaceae bacterium]|nr:KpsF/GutQ family sugar-phosphate isomerase [Azospirillaceae bacterium]